MQCGEDEGERETGFIDKLIYASVATHYSSDELGSLCAVEQNKCGYLKILEVRD
jgi:hypothetical protein